MHTLTSPERVGGPSMRAGSQSTESSCGGNVRGAGQGDRSGAAAALQTGFK